MKITYFDKQQKVIDTCLLYTQSVAGSFLTSFSGWEGFTEWKGKRIELQDNEQLIGFEVILDADKKTILGLNQRTWTPPKYA